MHRAERAQICYKLTDTRCDTRGYRHARASYSPPRETRAANGPGTILSDRSASKREISGNDWTTVNAAIVLKW